MQGKHNTLFTIVICRVTIMDKVQIHPTSFVDPNSPNASPKILAPGTINRTYIEG